MDINILKRYNRNKAFNVYSSKFNFKVKKITFIPLHYIEQGASVYYYKAFIIKQGKILNETTETINLNKKFYKTNNVGYAIKVNHIITFKHIIDNLKANGGL